MNTNFFFKKPASFNFQTVSQKEVQKIKLSFLRLTLTKRQKIIFTSVFLGICFALVTQTDHIFYKRYYLILIYGFLAYILSLWSLWEGMSKVKALVLMVLPVLFCIALASFYFVLQAEYIRWLTRFPISIGCMAIFYLLLLSQNVFNVAAQRTIPLYRAASTANLMFTLITAFLIFSVIYTFRLPFYWNGVLIAVLSFPLILQTLWSIEMENINLSILIHSLFLTLVIGEFAIAFSFWPIIPIMWSLALSTFLYVFLGITTHFFRERLTSRLTLEYVGIGGVVLLISILTTSWTG